MKADAVRSLTGGVAVVTGAGSGLGRAIATALAGAGCDLALADIEPASLAETAAGISRVRVTTARVDVASADEVMRFKASVERDFGRVSILVNNAGVALYGGVDDVGLEDLRWIMDVNFWGAVYGTKAFLPLLRREPAANVVTISSVFGLIAPAMQSGYCASKFAVRGFTEVLRHELERTTVRVTVVHPGGVRTNIAKNARRGAHADAERFRRDTIDFERALAMPPDEAARKIVRAIRTGRPRLLIGRDAFVLDALARLFPARYAGALRRLTTPTSRRPARGDSP